MNAFRATTALSLSAKSLESLPCAPNVVGIVPSPVDTLIYKEGKK